MATVMTALTGAAAETPRPKVAALLACHNRRELTLRALRSLDVARDLFDLSIVLLDDGSTDGTADAVRAEFPDAIILTGDGSHYWNGGMHKAWSHALTLKPDAYLWLNDDVALDADAMARLSEMWGEAAKMRRDRAFILIGTTRNAAGQFTYGGFRRSSRLRLSFERIGETTELTPVDTLNGNIVLIPAETVGLIGINDPGYFHMYGDIDYGLRASGAGIPVLQMPGTLGVCEANPGPDLGRMSLRARWRYLLRSPRGLKPASIWRFARKYSGVLAPFYFVSPYRRLFYPAAWLRSKP